MRAALIHELGKPPVAGQAPDPAAGEGQALVEVTAAPLNPIDLAIGRGGFYAGTPEVPFVPGKEAVGRVLRSATVRAGTRVYVEASGGIGSSGSLAELTVVPDEKLIALPEVDVPDSVAASLGIAGLAGWLPLSWRAALEPGQTVLVLGASGAVGSTAVQAAKLLGAGRVIAAARDAMGLARAKDLGADTLVELSGSSPVEELAAAFQHVAGGPVHVVVDPLWGPPAAAALQVLAPRGRLVQLGQAAGAEIAVASAAIRGKMVDLLGFTVLSTPADVKRAALHRMLEHVAAGELHVEVETLPLERVGEAWERQAGSPHHKLVVTP